MANEILTDTDAQANAEPTPTPTPAETAAQIQMQRILEDLRPCVQTLDQGFAKLFGLARRVQSGNLTEALTPELCAKYGTTPEKVIAVFGAVASLKTTVEQAQGVFDGVL
jgi:hypothetical protein